MKILSKISLLVLGALFFVEGVHAFITFGFFSSQFLLVLVIDLVIFIMTSLYWIEELKKKGAKEE